MNTLQLNLSNLKNPEVKLDGSHLLEIWKEGLETNWGKARFPKDRLDLMTDFFVEQIKTGPQRYEQYVAFFQYDATKKLREVTVPILFIRSTDDVFMCSAVDDWKRDQPEASLVEIEVESGGELPKLYPGPWANAATLPQPSTLSVHPRAARATAGQKRRAAPAPRSWIAIRRRTAASYRKWARASASTLPATRCTATAQRL